VGISVDRAGNVSATGLPGHIRWVPDRTAGTLLDPAAPLDAATVKP
jgi:hypothetical protein